MNVQVFAELKKAVRMLRLSPIASNCDIFCAAFSPSLQRMLTRTSIQCLLSNGLFVRGKPSPTCSSYNTSPRYTAYFIPKEKTTFHPYVRHPRECIGPRDYLSIQEEFRYLMEWPMWISRSCVEGGLEKWSLAAAWIHHQK